MVKKFLLISLVVVCTAALLFAGCSGEKPAGETASADEGASAAQTGEADVDNAQQIPDEEAAKSGDEQIKLGIIPMDIANEYFSSIVEAAQDYCDANGYNLTVIDGAGSPETQVTAMENMVSSGVQAFDLRAVDPAAVADAIKEVKKAGVGIATYPNSVEGADIYLQYDEINRGKALGEQACQWINENYDGKAEIVFLTMPENESVNSRTIGFREAIEEMCPEATIVAEQAAWNAVDGIDVTENVMQAHPNAQVFLCVNDGGAVGCDEGLAGMGLDMEKMWVGGVDADSEAIERIKSLKEGATNTAYRCTIGTSMTPRMAEEAMMAELVKYVKGEPYGDVMVDIYPITIESIDDYMALL